MNGIVMEYHDVYQHRTTKHLFKAMQNGLVLRAREQHDGSRYWVPSTRSRAELLSNKYRPYTG